MRRLLAVLIGCALALLPLPAHAWSGWGSPDYGDPPGWCTNFSDMWVTRVVTNDPLVATNPERDTFYGFHANPGYDDWYGFFYGDFRGRPGDSSGWVKLLHENYPRHYHWNFGDFGWAVHGHVKQYIAYYNWTFGGQCGLGVRGSAAPPPYMADQYGYPVVDIYVDAVAPYPPRPFVSSIALDSVTFTWDPVADRGDGAGRDYFVSGLGHYVSWITVDGRGGVTMYASSAQPRVIDVGGLAQGDVACVHVQAFDQAGNATTVQVACGAPLAAPPMPSWHAVIGVAANPAPRGLAGLETWTWLSPAPQTLVAGESVGAAHFVVTATPEQVDWSFGDGVGESLAAPSGFGVAYPAQSGVTHVYEAQSESGYTIKARITYRIDWSETVPGHVFGPYPMGVVALDAIPLTYPVEQAQPELLDV